MGSQGTSLGTAMLLGRKTGPRMQGGAMLHQGEFLLHFEVFASSMFN
jgi:hypothetical protein